MLPRYIHAEYVLNIKGEDVSVELFNDYAKFKEFVEDVTLDPAMKTSVQIFMSENSPTGSGWWAIVVFLRGAA